MSDKMKCPKHVEFHDKQICEIGAFDWFHYKEINHDILGSPAPFV